MTASPEKRLSRDLTKETAKVVARDRHKRRLQKRDDERDKKDQLHVPMEGHKKVSGSILAATNKHHRST